MEIAELRLELASRSGLNVILTRDGLKVFRHPERTFLDEIITFNDGRPHWTSGQPIDGRSLSEIAECIDRTVSGLSSTVNRPVT